MVLTEFKRKEIIKACLNENVAMLSFYAKQGIDFNSIHDDHGDTLLHLAVYHDLPKSFDKLMNLGLDLEKKSTVDGTTPLNLSVGYNDYYFFTLLQHGADINSQDAKGNTVFNKALQFDNNHNVINALLALPHLDVNTPNNDKRLPIERAEIAGDWETIHKIAAHPTFDAAFHHMSFLTTQELADYIYSKSSDADKKMIKMYQDIKKFGLQYDFDGCFSLEGLQNYPDTCWSFEGDTKHNAIFSFYASYELFYNQVVQQSDIPIWAQYSYSNIKNALDFTHHSTNAKEYLNKINAGELVIVSSGWSGHSVFFVIHNDTLYRCNRGSKSDGIHGIEKFIITKPEMVTLELIEHMINAKGSSDYLQNKMIDMLGLQFVDSIENPVQLVGNCSWTSPEAALEAAFIETFNNNAFAKYNFSLWEEFDLSTSLGHIVQHKDIFIENGVYDDLLIKALETHHNPNNIHDIERGVLILNELKNANVFSITIDENQVIAYDKFLLACDAYQQKKGVPLKVEDFMEQTIHDAIYMLQDIFTQPHLVINEFPAMAAEVFA